MWRTSAASTSSLFVGDLLDRYTPATAANRYRSLQQFFKFLVEEGEIKESPMANMTPPKIADHAPAVLLEDDLRKLLATCQKGQSFEDRRDLAILRLMVDTGCRIGEVLGLRWNPGDEEVNDVDLDGEVVRVLGKGRRWRLVSMGSKTARALDRYLRLRYQHSFGTNTQMYDLTRSGWAGGLFATTAYQQAQPLICKRPGCLRASPATAKRYGAANGGGRLTELSIVNAISGVGIARRQTAP